MSARSGEDVLGRPVFATGGYKPFRDFTRADVEQRAEELRQATGWGPTAKVAGVARAWSELSRAMAEAGAQRVADLDPELATDFATRLWVVPPKGGLL